jgi:hypothetical protein
MGQALLGKEVRIPCRHDALACEEPGVAVIRVESIPTPRIVTEHDVGSEHADPSGDLGPLTEAGLELAVDAAEEDDITA